jgi:hypothetical protein
MEGMQAARCAALSQGSFNSGKCCITEANFDYFPVLIKGIVPKIHPVDARRTSAKW